jgi:lipopolysaccharide biosynthesis glycosyltransferase
MLQSPGPIPIFIGYDPRERAATAVLIDSLVQQSSLPLAITPIVTPQLQTLGVFRRERDPKQATAFSFTRFLVPWLKYYQGWAIFMDCDMLAVGDVSPLLALEDGPLGVAPDQYGPIPLPGSAEDGEFNTGVISVQPDEATFYRLQLARLDYDGPRNDQSFLNRVFAKNRTTLSFIYNALTLSVDSPNAAHWNAEWLAHPPVVYHFVGGRHKPPPPRPMLGLEKSDARYSLQRAYELWWSYDDQLSAKEGRL